MRTVVLYGPQGCGKTRNAEAIRFHFGCASIVDGWESTDPIKRGALHIAVRPPLNTVALKRGYFYRKTIKVELVDYGTLPQKLRGQEPKTTAPVTKESNPKDGVGVRKWRQFVTVPLTVMTEVGVAMLEGHLKGYRRHNYRVAGVRASVYVDAAMGHITQWWEGEDLDPDTDLSHITKAIASLVVLRDSMIQNMMTDDRPPRANLDQVRSNLQSVVDKMFEKYPEPQLPYTQAALDAEK